MRLDVTLARIRALVGEDCVGKAALTDTHRPDSFRMEPFVIPSATASPSIPDEPAHSNPLVAMRQLRPPENVVVTLHGRQPAAFTFRERHYEVERAYGPWLTGGDWWNPSLWGLEQWDLIARSRDGALLCCCLVRNQIEYVWQMAVLYD